MREVKAFVEYNAYGILAPGSECLEGVGKFDVVEEYFSGGHVCAVSYACEHIEQYGGAEKTP